MLNVGSIPTMFKMKNLIFYNSLLLYYKLRREATIVTSLDKARYFHKGLSPYRPGNTLTNYMSLIIYSAPHLSLVRFYNKKRARAIRKSRQGKLRCVEPVPAIIPTVTFKRPTLHFYH